MNSKTKSLNVEFIKINGRFKIGWIELHRLFLLYLTTNMIFVLAFTSAQYLVSMKLIYYTIFAIFQILLIIFLAKILLRQVSFRKYDTPFSKEQNLKIILVLLENLSLPLYYTNDGSAIFSNYKYGPRSLKIYSKDVNFVVNSNYIMINFRNSNPNIFYLFGDTKEEMIENTLIEKIANKKLLSENLA